MCDTVPGELILCFARIDEAAHNLVSLLRHKKIEHVEYCDSLEDRLLRMNLGMSRDPDFELHRVRVPRDQESWKATYLQFFYKQEMLKVIPKSPQQFMEISSRSDYQFTVSPNHLLRVAGPATGGPVSAKRFLFGKHHAQYKQSIGLPSASLPNQNKIRVLLMDTGIAPDAPVPVSDRRNFVDSSNAQVVDDDHGHGTALALLIHDLAPNAEFLVYKVADATGRISEWDALAGIVARSDAHVVNLSMQFGLLDKTNGCAVCGRESRASRSAVFENIVNQFVKRSPRPVVIASAGNYRAQELAYPARFGDVLAIGGITSRRVLSSDCNRGDKDQAGDPHRNHFVLPGGESDPAALEPILTSAGGRTWTGSSFATGFASGLVAELLSRSGTDQFSFDMFVDTLRQTADKNLPNYSTADHGNGLMRA